MTRFVGLDVSQKLTAICVVDETGRWLWHGQSATDPEWIAQTVRGQAGEDAKVCVETGPLTPWLVHELRGRGLDVACLDARHASAAFKMQAGTNGTAVWYAQADKVRTYAALRWVSDAGRSGLNPSLFSVASRVAVQT